MSEFDNSELVLCAGFVTAVVNSAPPLAIAWLVNNRAVFVQ